MEDWGEEIWERANLFAAENGRSLIGQLGYGYEGNVFAPEQQSATKVLHGNQFFESEYFVGCDKRSAGTPFLLRIGVPARCLSHPTKIDNMDSRGSIGQSTTKTSDSDQGCFESLPCTRKSNNSPKGFPSSVISNGTICRPGGRIAVSAVNLT